MDPGSSAFLTPGSGIGKQSRSGSGLKILELFDADPDLGSGIFLTPDPGWKKFRSGIHPGSATLDIFDAFFLNMCIYFLIRIRNTQDRKYGSGGSGSALEVPDLDLLISALNKLK
jgi:hypothetical protein